MIRWCDVRTENILKFRYTKAVVSRPPVLTNKGFNLAPLTQPNTASTPI